MKNKISTIFKFIFYVNFLIISSALFIEFVLKAKPCVLCLYQRYPYYLILILSIVFFFKNNWKKQIIILIIICSISSFFLAGYHVGIEYGFINELSSCKVEGATSISKDLLLKELEGRLAPSCKDLKFRLFGFSLPLINAIISLILTVLYYKIFLWIKKIDK